MGGNGEIEKAHDSPAVADLIKDLPPAEVLACVMVAEYERPAAILATCTKHFGPGVITLQRVKDFTSPVHRPAKFQRIIQAMRQMAGVSLDEPILDPCWRMKQRRQVVVRAIGDGNYGAALEALAAVEKLLGTVPTQRSTGPVTAIQVNIGDPNRPPGNDAELEAWHATMLAELDGKCPGGNGDGQETSDAG